MFNIRTVEHFTTFWTDKHFCMWVIRLFECIYHFYCKISCYKLLNTYAVNVPLCELTLYHHLYIKANRFLFYFKAKYNAEGNRSVASNRKFIKMEGQARRARENEKPLNISGKVYQSVFPDILMTFYALGLGRLAPPPELPHFKLATFQFVYKKTYTELNAVLKDIHSVLKLIIWIDIMGRKRKSKLRKLLKIKKPPIWLFIPMVLFIKLMKFCMNTHIQDPNKCMDTSTYPYITVTWHNRLLFFPAMFPRFARKRTAAMISASRDGQYLSHIVKLFGLQAVRGSSSKRGAAALRESITCLENGNNVSMTPDGPRGPRYKLSRGPIILASKTGIPILPVAVNASSYWEAKSWDKFQIPKPWARVDLVIGAPVKIPGNLSDEEMEEWRVKIEKQLNEISRVEL